MSLSFEIISDTVKKWIHFNNDFTRNNNLKPL